MNSEQQTHNGFEDQYIACKDCSTVFIWTGGQRQFYFERQLSQPKRCAACRAARAATRERDGC